MLGGFEISKTCKEVYSQNPPKQQLRLGTEVKEYLVQATTVSFQCTL